MSVAFFICQSISGRLN